MNGQFQEAAAMEQGANGACRSQRMQYGVGQTVRASGHGPAPPSRSVELLQLQLLQLQLLRL